MSYRRNNKKYGGYVAPENQLAVNGNLTDLALEDMRSSNMQEMKHNGQDTGYDNREIKMKEIKEQPYDSSNIGVTVPVPKPMSEFANSLYETAVDSTEKAISAVKKYESNKKPNISVNAPNMDSDWSKIVGEYDKARKDTEQENRRLRDENSAIRQRDNYFGVVVKSSRDKLLDDFYRKLLLRREIKEDLLRDLTEEEKRKELERLWKKEVQNAGKKKKTKSKSKSAKTRTKSKSKKTKSKSKSKSKSIK